MQVCRTIVLLDYFPGCHDLPCRCRRPSSIRGASRPGTPAFSSRDVGCAAGEKWFHSPHLSSFSCSGAIKCQYDPAEWASKHGIVQENQIQYASLLVCVCLFEISMGVFLFGKTIKVLIFSPMPGSWKGRSLALVAHFSTRSMYGLRTTVYMISISRVLRSSVILVSFLLLPTMQYSMHLIVKGRCSSLDHYDGWLLLVVVLKREIPNTWSLREATVGMFRYFNTSYIKSDQEWLGT